MADSFSDSETKSETKQDNTRLPAFQQMQYAFTRHIREPEVHEAPSHLEDRRMKIYRDLFFNNVMGFIDNGFPQLKTHYSEHDWRKLVRAFFSRHESHSPYFIDISREFVHYLQDVHESTEADPPYLFELAHFEWAEVALMADIDDPDWHRIDLHGDLLAGQPVLSPAAYCLAYHWPVHRIDADYQPEKQPENPSFILIYQDGFEDEGGDVVYHEVDAITARIMELLQTNTDISGQQLLEQLAEEMQHPDPEEAVHTGHSILLKLHKSGIIPGTKKLD